MEGRKGGSTHEEEAGLRVMTLLMLPRGSVSVG